jgi:hypothetical protein
MTKKKRLIQLLRLRQEALSLAEQIKNYSENTIATEMDTQRHIKTHEDTSTSRHLARVWTYTIVPPMAQTKCLMKANRMQPSELESMEISGRYSKNNNLEKTNAQMHNCRW